jgi:tetratricopeptide (TPR) repeat protein
MMDRAIRSATEAVEMNAKCGVAYHAICFAHTMQSLFRWGDDPLLSADLAEEWAKKFFTQLPNSYLAYHCLGLARFRKAKFQDANRDFRRAHELNPNDTLVLDFWAWCEASAGEFESARKHAHLAIRLSPKEPFSFVSYLALAMAAFVEKDAADFEDWVGKAIQARPHAPIPRAMMIAYVAEAGDQALLETHRAELMRSSPDFIDSLFRGENQLFQQPEHTELLLDGLRKAGFPQ